MVDGKIYVPVDGKQKKDIERLKRIDNIRENEKVSFLVDHYEDDWTRLGFVLLFGSARIIHAEADAAAYERAVELLREKYAQYRGPITIHQWMIEINRTAPHPGRDGGGGDCKVKLSYQIATPDISTPDLPSAQGTLEENLACVAEAGFEGVELSVRKPDELDLQGIEKGIARRGLSVSMIHTAAMGFQDKIWLCHPVPEIRAVSYRRHLDALDMARRFGCGMVIGSSRGESLRGTRGRDDSLRWMRDALLGLADEAATHGLKTLSRNPCAATGSTT